LNLVVTLAELAARLGGRHFRRRIAANLRCARQQ
jgi:hypothetical protein